MSTGRAFQSTIKIEHPSAVICKIAQAFDEPFSINFAYLQKVLRGNLVDSVMLCRDVMETEDGPDYDHSSLDSKKPVYFSGERVFAIIMPMRG